MIAPVGMVSPISSHQAIASVTRVSNPIAFGKTEAYENQMNRFEKGEKLDVNCCGTREHSVCGQKLNYLA